MANAHKATLAVFATAASVAALHADVQYWAPDYSPTAPRTAGSNVWDNAGTLAWVYAGANNTVPTNNTPLVAWWNGGEARFDPFPNGAGQGVNHVTVNGAVNAGRVVINQINGGNPITFYRGDAPSLLRLAGPLDYTGGQAGAFYNDIELTANQAWALAGTVNLYGSLTGDYDLRKTGGAALNLYNPTNHIRNLLIEQGTATALAGGAIVTNGAVVLGAETQAGVATLAFSNTATPFIAGDLVAAGYGDFTLPANNNVAFGGLYRENNGGLAFIGAPAGNASFTNAADIMVGNMLPPWIVTSEPNFTTYTGGAIKTAPVKTAFVDWNASVIGHNNAPRDLPEGKTVLALKAGMAGSSLTIPDGLTLTNLSGGLILQGPDTSLLGGGTFDCGDNELVVYAYNNNNTATPQRINPRIIAHGLTVFGNINNPAPLTVNRITWTGDTRLQRGSLAVILDEDAVYTNNILGHAHTDLGGQFTKDGPAKLTFQGSDIRLNRLVWTRGDITLENGALKLNGNGFAVPANATLLVANSPFQYAGAVFSAGGNSTVEFAGSVLNGGTQGVTFSTDNNSFTAVDTPVTATGALTLSGNNNAFAASGNSMAFGNIAVSGAGNAFGTAGDTFASGTIIVSGNNNTNAIACATGANGQVNLSGDNNVLTLADGVFNFGGGRGLALSGSGGTLVVDGGTLTNIISSSSSDGGAFGFRIGSAAGSSDNHASIINGGAVFDNSSGASVCGVWRFANSARNTLEIIGGGGMVSLLRKTGAYSGFYVGSEPGANGNSVLVDGRDFPGSAQIYVDGATHIGRVGGFGNTLTICDGGQLETTGSFAVGMNRDTTGLTSNNNKVFITGEGTKLTGAANFSIGHPGGSATIPGYANNNEVLVAFGAVADFTKATGGNTAIGGPEVYTPYGESIGNKLTIATNGVFKSSRAVYVGMIAGETSVARDNILRVTGPGARLECALGVFVGYGQESGPTVRGNRFIVEDEGVVTAANLTVGYLASATTTGDSHDNKAIIRDGGSLFLSGQVNLGNAIGGVHLARDNSVEVTTGGMIEVNTVAVPSMSNNTFRVSDGGIWQLREARVPTVPATTTPRVFIENATVSFTNAPTTVVITDNRTQAGFTRCDWAGHNTFRLNYSSLSASANQGYIFDPTDDPTNYARLEMVNGDTVYQGSGGTLQIGSAVGSGASMLCLDTAATVTLPFICNGELSIINSTLTLLASAEINGDVSVDLDNLPANGLVIDAKAGLTINGASIHFSGTLPEGTHKIISGVTSGRFATATGLPENFSLKHIGDGVYLHHSIPTTIFMVR